MQSALQCHLGPCQQSRTFPVALRSASLVSCLLTCMLQGLVRLKHSTRLLRAAASWVQNEPRQVVSDSEELTDGLRTQVLFAREYLKEVNISEKQVERLVMEAARGACQGHRSELFAARVAKASAALDVSLCTKLSSQHHAHASYSCLIQPRHHHEGGLCRVLS